MRGIAIFGSGGLGKELIPLVRSISSDVIFVDDDPDKAGHTILGVPICEVDAIADREVVIAIASPIMRKKVAERFRAKASRSLVAPTMICDPASSFGEGALFSHYTLVSTETVIGRYFHCNYHALVAHDCVIGDFVTLGPRATICGNVVVEDGAYIGANAVIRQGMPGCPLVIGAGAIVGMGAVVLGDVPAGTAVVGNPARRMRG